LGRLRRPQDQAEYASAHVLLRRLLGERLGTSHVVLARRPCTSCGQAHGRPYVARPVTDLELSLCHGGGLAVVALSDRGPVGVDTEALPSPGTVSEVMGQLHPDERRELGILSESERAERFAVLWTRTEAYLKAIGTGLAREPWLDYVGTVAPERHPAGWRFHDVVLAPGTRTAVCTVKAVTSLDVVQQVAW